MYIVPHIINGQIVNDGDHMLEIFNPTKGQIAGKVHVADALIVNTAVEAAQQAFATWSRTPIAYRMKLLFKLKSLLDRDTKIIAKLVSTEHGKTIAEAIGSVQRGIEVVDYCCGIANQLKGGYLENIATNMNVYSIHQPVGVCVGITPFNFPAMIPLWMFPMAIACGNTFILKPSEKDPSCSVHLLSLVKEAGFPDGVVNLIQGDKSTVELLVTHPRVSAVSFVGSTPVARSVYRKAVQHGKRAQAFGGAKNHCIVMPDADIDATVEALIPAAYGSSGERCMAISVIVAVGDTVADQLIATMVPKIKDWKVGPSEHPETRMGPLVTQSHLERVLHYIDQGKKEGAKLVVDGSQKPPSLGSGFYMGCSLFDAVTPSMAIYKEEIFGPVLCIVRVKSFEEGLELITSHEFGNGTAIFTRDGATAKRFSTEVQVGMVGVNVPVPVPVAYHSFSGWKNSVFADVGMYGTEGVRFYTKIKTITEKWQN